MPDAGEEFLPRSELTELQGKRLAWLLDKILPYNCFYALKFKEARLTRDDIQHIDHLARLPFTTKAELLADQQSHPPYGHILTYPLVKYRRFHQTSGTLGQPLRWLDTEDSWNGMLACWDAIFRFVELTESDRLFFAFSFGPFLGFWTAFDAARRLGCLCLTGGGMSSVARVNMLLENQATVIFCTPTYALRLAEVAREQHLPLEKSAVRAIIVAGEPGGSIPAVRQRIEDVWQARVFDHSGMTEVGPMSIECRENAGGLHILEGSYLAEVIDPATGAEVPDGQPGELVVTNLTRWGSPVLRYRTGDLVRVQEHPCVCGRTFRRLDGGILGRTDDMIHLRGINVYPAALENVIRRFPDVVEYRIMIDASQTQSALRIEVEPAEGAAGLAEKVGQAIRDELLFRPEVTLVAAGALPRFEMKGRRIVHKGP